MFNPYTITTLQKSVREKNYKLFKDFSKAIDNQAEELCTIRGFLNLLYAILCLSKVSFAIISSPIPSILVGVPVKYLFTTSLLMPIHSNICALL